MPPSQKSHKNAKSKEPLEVRRSRGEISCAECRRHKLKCNRAIPCNTCIRKGCPELCPNGTLSPGQNGRQSSGNDDTSMEKLMRMSQRIQQLEDALQIAHTSISAAPHPLLSQELLRIKSLIERPVFFWKKESDTSDEDTVASHGTLAMLGRGMESYVGTDKFIIDHFGHMDALHLKLNQPVPIPYPNETFPFTPLYLPAQEIQAQIEEKLPTIERASALIEAYLENISWIHRVIDREQIVEDLVPRVYWRRRSSRNNDANGVTMTDPHMLSTLLGVFACGAVADLTRSPWNEEAELYHNLAWTAVSLRPVFDGANLHTVQTLSLLGTYDVFSCRKTSLDGTWKLIGFCMSLASSIGLREWHPVEAFPPLRPDNIPPDRDPTHFNLPPKVVQRRRQVFWELHASDVWRSIGSGRPMTFPSSVVDCELPEDKDATVGDDGRQIPSSWGLRYRYSKEVMAEVAEKLVSARALKYSEILELDQKIHEFDPEKFVSSSIDDSAKNGGSSQSGLPKFLWVLLKDASLLLLHRNFFIRALVVNPTNPMQCQFAPSFLSTYRSATTILRALRELSGFYSQLLIRIWPIWAHALSATVIVGSVAACGAESDLAPQAFVELNQSIEMLSKVQLHPIVKDLMPMLFRLRDQARGSLLRHGNLARIHRPPVINRPPTKEEEKEFNIVSSMGRVIQMGLKGQYQSSEGLISGMLDETMSPGSMTPSSTPTSSGPPEDVYSGRTSFDHGFMSLGRNSLGSDQKGAFGRTYSDSMGLGTVTIGGTTGLLHSSPQSIDDQRDTSNLQCQSSDTNGLHLPSQPQDRPLPIAPSDRSPASKLQEINRQDLNAFYGTNNEQCRPSNEFHGFPAPLDTRRGDYYAASESHHAQVTDPQTPVDNPHSPLNFDTSGISPKALFGTDFDVSFDMRACAGNENVLPLISDDLAAWHTILRDSRFFGNGDTVSEI